MAADETLVEERDEEMVAFLGSRVPIKRKGWFLKPTSNPSESSLFYPFSSPSSSPCNFMKTPNCSFKGWVCSLRFWDQWVEKLRPRYGDLWKKVGILEAINASRYKFKRDTSSLWGVARFWCEETSTFIFPWAEATVTLEDVMVLGGFSVLGEPIRSGNKPLEGELGELAAQMVREVRRFNQTKSKKADITTWLKYYLEDGNGGELEHIAFLALWLNRFVLLAPPARTIGFHVIPVAVRLARGARIALAPAVLASIYRDLRVMKDYLAVYGRPETPALTLWAPLHILQLWIWERFLALRPESASFVGSDVPRAARWHNVGKTLKYGLVKSVIKSQDEIQWRPYLASWVHGRKPSYYRDDSEWICTREASDEGLESFSQCLRTCELVGLDSIQQYLPHRVARQFGLDQDIPSFVPRATSTWEAAWRTFDVCAKNVKFYVPSRLFESDVTLQYSVWWARVRRLLRKKMRGKKRKKTQSLECCYKKELQDGDDIPISKWVPQKNQRISKKHRCEDPSNSATVTATQDHHACIKNTEICGELKLSLDGYALSSIKVENGAVASNPMGVEYNRVNGAITSYPMEIDDKEIFGYTEETSAGESVNGPIMTEEIKENVKMEEVEESNEDNRSDSELIIEKLKVEIALIHARVKNVESLSKR